MYVEAIVLAVKTAKKAEYLAAAKQMSALMMDYGALSVVENWGDDVPNGTLTSFPRALQLEADETVVLSWITFPDKATRDHCNTVGMEDARVAPLMEAMPTDGKRMFFGGFETVLQT